MARPDDGRGGRACPRRVTGTHPGAADIKC